MGVRPQSRRPDSPAHPETGQGVLDFEYYLSRLKNNGFKGPLILHGLEESEVSTSHAFLKKILEQI